MPLLQFLGPLHDKLLDLPDLPAECRGEFLLAGGKVVLLGVHRGLVLAPSGLVLGGLLSRCLLGLLDICLLHDKLQLALGQQILSGLQFLIGLAEPSPCLGDAPLEVRLALFTAAILDLALSRRAQ